MSMRWPALAALLVAASCSTAGQRPSPPEVTGSTPPPSEEIVLIRGTAPVPAANGFSDPGFHLTVDASGRVDTPVAGGTIIVRLWDATRPDRTCNRHHPLSGCLTVDWSDFEGRPRVPPGGVFDNSVRLSGNGDDVVLYLTEREGLAGAPDPYVPT